MKCASYIVIKLTSLREDAASTTQAFGGRIFQDFNSACNFLHYQCGEGFLQLRLRKLIDCISVIDRGAAKIIHSLPKILWRVHWQT